MNVQLSKLGFYRVIVRGSPETVSDAASLQAFSTSGTAITVFGPPEAVTGTGSSCPLPYVGYVNYKKPDPAWGWKPSAATTHSATDGGGRINTKIQICGAYGDAVCAVQTISTNRVVSPEYRFGIYFPRNLPTTNYPVVIDGFLQ